MGHTHFGIRLIAPALMLTLLAACGGGAATSAPVPAATMTPAPTTAPAATVTPASAQASVPTVAATATPVLPTLAATAPAVAPTPTPSPISGLPEHTEVTIWPTLLEVQPPAANPGDDVQARGKGGHTEIRAPDGSVAGYIESARSFDLYFDGEPAGSIECYVNVCLGAFTVPAGAAPGSHEISVEGGSSASFEVPEPPSATQEAAPTMTAQPTETPEPLTLRVTAFPEGDTVPVRYTCDGDDISPALSWNSRPPGTESFVIVMDDPDAPGGTWDHWVLFNYPADKLELPEGQPKTPQLPGGGVHGSNSWGETGYSGPCPPSGPAHTYRFYLYAVDHSLDLPAGASKQEVLDAISRHILAASLHTGTYGR